MSIVRSLTVLVGCGSFAAVSSCAGPAGPIRSAPCPSALASVAPPKPMPVKLEKLTAAVRGRAPLSGGEGAQVLRALDSEGRERWAWGFDTLDAYAPDGESGAFVACSLKRKAILLHVLHSGAMDWARPAEAEPGSGQRLGAGPSSITYVYRRQQNAVVVFLDRDGGVSGRWELGPVSESCLSLGPDASLTLSSVGGDVRRYAPDGKLVWSSNVLRPAGDRSLRWNACPQVLPDALGRTWIATPDGMLGLLDGAGRRLWQAGLRSRVRKLGLREDGAVMVGTFDDRDAVVLPGAEPVLVAANAGAEPAEEVAEPLSFRLELQHEVSSVVALSREHVVALGTRSWTHQPSGPLSEWSKGRWSTRDVPQPTAKEVFAEGRAAGVGSFEPMRLGVGDNGALWLLGDRHLPGDVPNTYSASALRVLQSSPAGWAENKPLQRALWAQWQVRPPVVSTGPGDKIVCAGRSCMVHHGSGWVKLYEPLDEEGVKAAHALASSAWLVGRGSVLGWRNGVSTPGAAHKEDDWRAVWAASDSDVWVGGKCAEDPRHKGPVCGLLHFDGKTWSRHSSPAGTVQSLWGSGPSDVWAAGAEGASHFDGKRWVRVAGIGRHCETVSGTSSDDVWIGCKDGLHHGTAWPVGDGPMKALREPALAMPPFPTSSTQLLQPGAGRQDWKLEPMELAGDSRIDHAQSVACTPSGQVWLLNEDGVWRYDGSAVRAIAREPRRPWLLGHGMLAPESERQGWYLGDRGIMEVGLDGARPARHPMEGPGAAAAAGGAVWIVSSTQHRGGVRALSKGASGWTHYSAVPEATYVAVSLRGADEAWIAGGLGATVNATRAWPSGEGILLHRDGSAFRWYRVADAPLLAAAATGPGEAWAAGAAGVVVHALGGRLEIFRLPSEPWMRAVSAASSTDVWFGGDDATLLHWDGKTMQVQGMAGVAPTAAVTSIAACGDGTVWVAGPTLLRRLKR
ncbi:MAG: hypothetical protein HY898_24065 [Deltaproteobacteria bacterium]|nr:hypothetical protein [Deltaproteobacteria bacterium]